MSSKDGIGDRRPPEFKPGRPKIHRKIGNRIEVDVLGGGDDDVDYAAGIGHYDFGGGMSGFGRYAASQHVASSGAGTDVSYSYEERRSGGEPGFSGVDRIHDGEDYGEMDLFGEPSHDRGNRGGRDYPRAEHGDFPAPEEHDDLGYLLDDVLDDHRSSPTVDPGEGRSPTRDAREDAIFASTPSVPPGGTFARRGLR